MLKRVALFILAHLAFFGVAAALVAASTTDADAQSSNPYDMRFALTQDAPMRAAPELESAISGQVAGGTRDIILRLCRPEVPFEQWMFGSQRVQNQLMDERVCEVDVAGRVGFIEGRFLRAQ